MLVLKSTHLLKLQEMQARIDELETRHAYQQMAEQALRNNLYAQIEDLRKLVFPQVAQDSPRDAREADAVLTASQKSPDMSEEELNKILTGERELDLLLSGNYDTELVN